MLASVRRSNWTCGFPASSFHKSACATQEQRKTLAEQAHKPQRALTGELGEELASGIWAPAAENWTEVGVSQPRDLQTPPLENLILQGVDLFCTRPD